MLLVFDFVILSLSLDSIFAKLNLSSLQRHVIFRDGWMDNRIYHCRGHYKYLVMPYGLTNAPSIFQSLMNEIFQDMENTFLIVYINGLFYIFPQCNPHQTLKNIFISTPGLKHPDLKCSFTIEMGVEVILPQYHGALSKLFPCDLISYSLSSPERNYDVGNCRLSSWHSKSRDIGRKGHIVITDHQKLEYIWHAKNFNPLQAQYAFLFSSITQLYIVKKNKTHNSIRCPWRSPSPRISVLQNLWLNKAASTQSHLLQWVPMHGALCNNAYHWAIN